MNQSSVPAQRIRPGNEKQVNPDGEFVLYWMIANRRTQSNYSLDRAIDWCHELNRPLVILEALRCGYRWASDRIHVFVIQGMIDNQRDCERAPVSYYPYIESSNGAGKGLLAALAARACVVVSDDFPCSFLPRMIESAARQIPVKFELVDSNGMIPVRATDRVYSRAHDFRRYLQKNIGSWLVQQPRLRPLNNLNLPLLPELPQHIVKKWPIADLAKLDGGPGALEKLPIDHSVIPTEIRGGSKGAGKQLRRFVSEAMLGRYSVDRNQPEQDVASGLSPWLHFGHISSHQIFKAVCNYRPWSVECISENATGSSRGWWGAAPEVESFLDEMITWRELGYNRCGLTDNYDQYESLPEWAQNTLADHQSDRRPYLYSLDEFAQGMTHDELWNAAQNQLAREGRIHNYLRMLWGKKILEWTESPRQALEFMIELNNKFALDGRNPNSYSGIFWVLGRYDRAWGPERPIYGKVRYMTSENTARKVKVKDYIRRYASPVGG